VPVKQIEDITRKPVVSVVLNVLSKVDANTAEHNESQPNIIRLPMAAPAPEEIHHNEELARRLDGKNSNGTRTELSVVAISGQPGNHEPRVPGRLIGATAPFQSPYATPEQPNPALTKPVEQALPQLAIPDIPLVGLSIDSDRQNKGHEVGRNQETLVTDQPSDQQSSANIQPTIPVQSQTDGVSAPLPVTARQSVSANAAAMPSLQNDLQPLGPVKQSDDQ
jgi:hypothetical protein